MDEIIALPDLKIGQWVKVKGQAGRDGAFDAVEITVCRDLGKYEVLGLLRGIDLERRRVCVCQRWLQLPPELVVKDQEGNRTRLEELRPNCMVKVKGSHGVNEGFQPHSLRLAETREFNIEKIIGTIDKIELQQSLLEVTGFTIKVRSGAIIEI